MESEYNPDSDLTLVVRHGGALFSIRYVGARMSGALPSVLQEHRKLYDICHDGHPDRGSHEAVVRLREPFDELMAQLAPNPPPGSPEFLHKYLYPPYFVLEAVIDRTGHVQPRFTKLLSRQGFYPPGEHIGRKFLSHPPNLGWLRPHISPLLGSNISIYPSREIQILDYRSRDQIPSMVRVNDTIYFFKPWVSGRFHSFHALEVYRKMLEDAQARPPLLTDARICHFHGLVVDKEKDVLRHYPIDSDEEYSSEDDVPRKTPRFEIDEWTGSRLVGLLLIYIENKGTMDRLSLHPDSVTDEDRARWSAQIHESVERLHRAGVAWGDAKPENVLIDTKGDAHLIDFGGSYTQGWVDKENRMTMEGDLQALQRIDDWLAEWSARSHARLDKSSSHFKAETRALEEN